MRKTILFIITTLFFIGVNGQVTTLIPDANFEQALINLGLDNGAIDGSVLTVNISTVSVLDVTSSNISSLAGIENFSALTSLNCSNNQLTSLDVTQNLVLTSLNCINNQLMSLYLTQNSVLQSLTCFNNQITSIDVSQNTSLSWLNCFSNQLTSLDVSHNTDLIFLSCDSNQITSIDVSQNVVLTSLYCGVNQLTKLDVSQNLVLTELECSNNQLSCLNVKNGNNSNLSSLEALGNSNLSCVEVDDDVWSTANWTNIDAGVSFDTDCFGSCSVVGIDDNGSASSFSLYPNPASNNVTIDFEKEEQLINLSIINVHGQQVLSNEYKNTDGVRLNVEDLSSGVYFIQIVTNEGSETVKFIKE